MQLSAIFVSLSVLIATVAAAPAPNGHMLMGNRRAAQGAVGAAYFITNDPTGNFIVSADIQSNGKIALHRAVATNGVGAHGKVAADGPDALFSQGSVKASASGKVLAAVNAGSNTVSLFAIDQNRPAALSMLGQPMSSGGEFPISLAFNKAGSMLCVLNGGAAAGVKCFSVDAKKGLSGIANTDRVLSLNQTTPATGPAGSASHILFSEDGTQLLASIKGTPAQPGFLAIWDVAAKDNSLSAQFAAVKPASGALPFGMSLIPGANAVLATDPAIGFDVVPFGKGAVAGTASSTNVSGQAAVCWSSHSAKTGNFYLTDIGTSLVTEVSVDKNLKAKIVKQYQQAMGSATIDTDIATVGSQEFLYILGANKTQVQVMSLSAPGKAASIQNIDISAPAKRAGLTLSGLNLQGMTTFIKA